MIFNLTPPESTAVEFIEQTLTDTQKAQARTNIGALSIDDVPSGGMELLGEAQITGMFQASELKLPIPSGYRYYYIPFHTDGRASITIETVEASNCWKTDRIYSFDVMCSSSGTISGDASSLAVSSYAPSSTLRYGSVTNCTGYLIWCIEPCGSMYRCVSSFYSHGEDKLRNVRIGCENGQSLRMCTPKSITLSDGITYYQGRYYLDETTGVTVYGIK